MYSDEMTRALEELDVRTLRRLWRHVAPGLPQPADDEQALVSAHMARTASDRVRLHFRAYSHRWLTERDLPSQLPDWLKPQAERLYPRIVTAVGVSVTAVNKHNEPLALAIRDAMNAAILDAYAEGHADDPAFIKARMTEARVRALRER